MWFKSGCANRAGSFLLFATATSRSTVTSPASCRTDRGTEWGTCLLPPEPVPYEMERRYSMRVIRRATPNDQETQNYLVAEEQKARKIGEKIRRHNLPMKLVDVEFTFDKQKIVFYFTAEEWVDFRDLVRDLAHDLRARIGACPPIQVRDEAKMVGGIGGCGRELCCTTWLGDFMPISMRMAKKQNLSLNPSKSTVRPLAMLPELRKRPV